MTGSAQFKIFLRDYHVLDHLLSGLLVQLTPVLVQDMLWVVVGSQEADIVDLGPATLLRAQEVRLATKNGLEALESP
jgi:hypothetical protein